MRTQKLRGVCETKHITKIMFLKGKYGVMELWSYGVME